MLPVCNDRASVIQLLDSMPAEADPLRQVRLVRLHGRPAPDRAQLLANDRWRAGAEAAAHCMDVPELRLDA